MKINVYMAVRFRKTIEIPIDRERFDLFMSSHDDEVSDMISNALPGFGEWDDVDIDIEQYEPIDEEN